MFASMLALVSALMLAIATPSLSLAEDWFIERAAESGLDFVHTNGMSGRLYYPEVVGAGGALFDYDNDGDLDVYLVQGAMLGRDRTLDDALIAWRGERAPRDRLFRNDLEILPGGDRRLHFVDVTETSGIRAHKYGMGVAAADIDNDGWVDLYVLNFGTNQLWRNRGDGTFVEEAAARGIAEERWSVSASFADFDRDGWLDLFVANYLDYSFVAHKTCLTERGEADYCLPGAYRPVPDRLYRNRGDGTFEDVSVRAGIAGVAANGLGVVAADFNADSRLDFYVANDLMANHLWLGQGDGTFVEDGLAAGVALNAQGKAEASMGIAVGDPDADGDLDLFLTHFRRESNTFYRDAGPYFEDATESLGLAAPSWLFTAFGTCFLDYDADGWLDLVTVNGAVTFLPGADRTRNRFPLDERNQLFKNVEGRRFEETSDRAGAAFAISEISRGALCGDLDNDGDTDIVVTNNSGPVRLLMNRVADARPWLGLDLVVAGAGRPALGAIATLKRSAGPALVRHAHADGGYASSSDPRVLFGLGNGEARSLQVVWPSGKVEEWQGFEPGRYHRLVEGTGRPPQ